MTEREVEEVAEGEENSMAGAALMGVEEEMAWRASEEEEDETVLDFTTLVTVDEEEEEEEWCCCWWEEEPAAEETIACVPISSRASPSFSPSGAVMAGRCTEREVVVVASPLALPLSSWACREEEEDVEDEWWAAA